MRAPVPREMVRAPEPGPTSLAHVRALVRMHSEVLGQVGRLGERGVAALDRACEGPVARVRAHVACQRGRVRERLAAGRADVRALARVRPPVLRERRHVREALAARLACMRLVSCSLSVVCFSHQPSCPLPRRVGGKRTSVDDEMPDQLLPLHKRLVLAAVGLPAAVPEASVARLPVADVRRLRMLREQRRAPERLPASLPATDERLLRRRRRRQQLVLSHSRHC